MADATLTSNRRSFLGGGALAVAAVSLPATIMAANHPAAWDMAVRRVAETELAESRFYANHVAPVIKARAAGLASYADILAAEDAAGPYRTAHGDAVDAMTLIPAPTLKALKYKVETARDDGLFDGTDDDSAGAIDAIIADISRLLGDA